MWQYQLNAHKSSILVFGETAGSRKKNHTLRKWIVDGETVPESDSQKHLGILHTVFSSSVHQTVERCSAGRSAFYALNGVGSRFGCIHPITSLRLYLTLCIPVLLYGCELWSLTGCECSDRALLEVACGPTNLTRKPQLAADQNWVGYRTELLHTKPA